MKKHIFGLAVVLVCSIIPCSCKKDRVRKDIAIGDSYGGGVVGYIYQSYDYGYIDGEIHGLIVAPRSLGALPWGCQGTSVGGTLFEMGNGMKNTECIVEVCTSPGIAAKRCYDLEVNGFSDWFLPSQDELGELYKHKSTIDSALSSIGGLPFVNSWHWSSSECGPSCANAFGFDNGYDQYSGGKDDQGEVRAIRAF